jgi:hypothetical protein
MAQDDAFHQVKRRKRHISNNTSQTVRKSTKPFPRSAAVKMPQKALLTRNFFATVRTTDMDTETTGAQNALRVQEAPRKSGRPPPIMMTSNTNLIRLQTDLKDHVKGEYEFRNTRSRTRIIAKEMVDYSAMKPYLEQNDLRYFTISPNSEIPIKAAISRRPSDMLTENISSSLENLGFNVINGRQMTAIRIAPNGQRHMETLPLFLVTLTGNVNSQEIFNSLNHIIIKVELHRAQTGLSKWYNCQNFGHVWANDKQTLRCLWCGGGHLNRECPEKTNTVSTPSCCNCTLVGEKTFSVMSRLQPCERGMQRRRTQRAPKVSSRRKFCSTLTSPEQSFAAALHQDTQHQQPQARRHVGKASGTPCSSICHNGKFREQVCQYRLPVRLTR